MQEMDRRIALLRLLLADITGRERDMQEAIGQLRQQIRRVVDFTVQRNGSIAGALSGLSEIEERLAQQEMALRHLGMLHARAAGELEALQLTRIVGEARVRLAELEARRDGLVAAAAHASLAVDAEEARSAAASAADDRARPGTSDTPEGLARGQQIMEVEAEIAEIQRQIQTASEDAARALTRSSHQDISPQQQ